MKWFEELGFDYNPFSTESEFAAQFAVGLDEAARELLYFVKSADMAFVEGSKGTGKSVLLHKLAQQSPMAVYFDCAAQPLDVKRLLMRKSNWLKRLFGYLPTGVVLLLDNANNLPQREMDIIKYYYDNNFVASVVFSAGGLRRAKLSKGIIDRIGGRVIKLRQLDEEDAILMVSNRLGSYASLLPAEVVRAIFKEAKRDNSTFLQLCEKVCSEAVNAKAKQASEEHLKAALEKQSGVSGQAAAA